MVEVGLAVLLVSILVLADRQRLERAMAQVRRFLDWVEKAS